RRQAKYRECALEHLQGKSADRPIGRPNRSNEMGRDQEVDKISWAACSRRKGAGEARQSGSPVQSLDRGARWSCKRTRRTFPADSGDRANAAGSDRSNEAL